ncbi:MAG TPA: hypothetical protein VFU22_08215 [Roseiflexaceae bacterium]|nr:hypothetical protein [Roseiflexaceae bacterium]
MEPLSPYESSSAALALHQALVDTLQRDGFIQTSHVLAAFHAIPRHLFLPGVALNKVYQNEPVATLRRPDGRAQFRPRDVRNDGGSVAAAGADGSEA